METIERSPTTGSLVWRLSLRWRATVDRAVVPHGLTHATYSVLASLFGQISSGVSPSQRELADVTGLEPPYMSKLVASLERAGLVERSAHPGDTRAVQLSLTPAGRSTVQAAIATVASLHEELLAPIGGPGSPDALELKASLSALLADPTTRPASWTHNSRTDIGRTNNNRTPNSRTPNRRNVMTTAPPLTGQDINLAARATRQLLVEQLDTIDLPFDEWIVLNLIASGQVADEPELRRRLAGGLGLEERAIDRLVQRLVDDGQVDRRPGSIALGPSGRRRWEQGDALTTELVQWIYDGFDPDDLAVARRVLVEVTARAERRLLG